MKIEEARALVGSISHWHHRFEIFPGITTPGTYDPSFLLRKMKLPEELHGKRVLDIGASDGFFTLELARRGARVVAIDYRSKDSHGFGVMEKLNGVDIEYHQMNLYNLSAEKFGQFDIIVFMGVLYHLPDMLRALAKVRELSVGTMFLETHADTSLESEIAAARYYRGSSLAGDITNFWSPNRRCVLDMLADAGFQCERDEAWGDRLFVVTTVDQADTRISEKMRLAYTDDLNS
jgi:tRNA (mo5U34)-methyltransferase